MTVSDLIEQLQQFHGHESVMVYIHRVDVCELTDPLGKEYGWTKEQVRALMAHGDTKTTDIYLTAPEALTDEHFRRVEATMNLKQLLEIEP